MTVAARLHSYQRTVACDGSGSAIDHATTTRMTDAVRHKPIRGDKMLEHPWVWSADSESTGQPCPSEKAKSLITVGAIAVAGGAHQSTGAGAGAGAISRSAGDSGSCRVLLRSRSLKCFWILAGGDHENVHVDACRWRAGVLAGYGGRRPNRHVQAHQQQTKDRRNRRGFGHVGQEPEWLHHLRKGPPHARSHCDR